MNPKTFNNCNTAVAVLLLRLMYSTIKKNFQFKTRRKINEQKRNTIKEQNKLKHKQKSKMIRTR